jgi:predicted nucleic-acid-binding protein
VIAADTNVWARAILGDDRAQAASARRDIQAARDEGGVFVPLIVLAELAWVLGGADGWTRAAALDALDQLVRTEGVVVEAHALAREALQQAREGKGGLADYLIAAVARHHGCSELLTFDRRFGKGKGVRVIS